MSGWLVSLEEIGTSRTVSGFVLQDAPCSIGRASLERQRNEPILRTHEVSILSTPASSVLAISSSSTSDLSAGRQNDQPTANTGTLFRPRVYKYTRLPILPSCLAVVYRRECMFLRKKKSNWSQRVQWSFLYRRYHKYFRKTQCRRERVRARACLDSHPDAGPCSVYGDITLT